MAGRASRNSTATLLGAVALVVLAVAGCGGGDTTSTTSSVVMNKPGPSRRRDDEGRAPRVAPLKVSGGGSSQFKVDGGDNSISEFGQEAARSELTQAARVVHSFFAARARGEWARACSLLGASQRSGVGKFAAGSSGEGGSCQTGFEALFSEVSPAEVRQLTAIDAASLRRKGDQAFLIYTAAPGNTVYAMPLRREDGTWRLAALSGTELPGA
jgi:hypothetical protein